MLTVRVIVRTESVMVKVPTVLPDCVLVDHPDAFSLVDGVPLISRFISGKLDADFKYDSPVAMLVKPIRSGPWKRWPWRWLW